ncbi:MAG TPA: toll/interleukin-1 receptor domain-containing protein [Woeseiaceae bacterium]|nr:toll/interleukin-1 receptor domain-containing protein [Woeseiaceae bacterium]
MKAFISYSHHDESALDRLHTHLAMLRREGRIVDWFDREILAGGVLDKEITKQLETCYLFLPLVSPEFLASNYCYETEMARALERHDAGEVRVVPIIIEPCDWTASPLRKLKALPKDGKPVAEWTNQNTAFLDVVTELRRIVSEDQVESSSATASPSEVPMPEGRRYRICDKLDDPQALYFGIEATARLPGLPCHSACSDAACEQRHRRRAGEPIHDFREDARCCIPRESCPATAMPAGRLTGPLGVEILDVVLRPLVSEILADRAAGEDRQQGQGKRT